MIRKVFVFVSFTFFAVSCKSISVAHESQIKTSQHIELGTIGEDKVFVLEEDYNATAIPAFNKPVKVSVDVLEFNKSSFKAFATTNTKRETPLKLDYVDSLDTKPKFLKLEIADRVSVIEALNAKENDAVKNFINNKNKAHIISAISIVFDQEKMTSILDADAFFLEESTNNTFVIKTYKDNNIQKILKFNDGVVFAYQPSNFCWQEDDRRQLNIVDIVESTDKCPSNTYRSAKRAKKKINYYKF